MCQLSPIAFHGDTIYCVIYNDEPYIPMKPIVENMGLDWRAQATKLRSNKARWGVVIIATPSEGGEQETTCLPLRKYPAWLSSLTPSKVRKELRAKIELYQNESDDALWNYWMNGKAERATSSSQCEDRLSKRTDPERKQLTGIINAWVGMAPIHYATARAQVNAHFGVTGIDDLTVSQVKAAIQWVQAKIDALAENPAIPMARFRQRVELEGKYQEYLEAVEKWRLDNRAESKRHYEGYIIQSS